MLRRETFCGTLKTPGGTISTMSSRKCTDPREQPPTDGRHCLAHEGEGIDPGFITNMENLIFDTIVYTFQEIL
ncbi:unnamed protein product [Arctogadus glacialis]